MKSIPSFLLLFALLFSIDTLSAQKEETLVGSRGLGLSGAWGGSKHQLAYFEGQANPSYVNGGFLGLEFGKALLVGWSHYDIVDEFKWDKIKNQDFDLHYNQLLLQYGFKNYKPIHPQIGVELGKGTVKLGDEKDRIFIVQPSAGVEFNVFRWFHIGLDGGYRFVNDSSISDLGDKALSGWYAEASLKFGFSWGRYHKKVENKPKNYED